MTTCPQPYLHAEGQHHHSARVRSQDDGAAAPGQLLLHPISTAHQTAPLPLIHGATQRSSSGTARLPTARKSTAALAVADTARSHDPVAAAGYAPNVGGFAGARIAAVQARLNTVTRGAAGKLQQ